MQTFKVILDLEIEIEIMVNTYPGCIIAERHYCILINKLLDVKPLVPLLQEVCQ